MIWKAKLLKIYVGESQRYKRKNMYQFLVNWLKEKGMAGVTVSRGIVGYGKDSIIHSARILELSSDLPIVIEVIDTEDKIDSILPEVCSIVSKGLVFTADIEVHKYGDE